MKDFHFPDSSINIQLAEGSTYVLYLFLLTYCSLAVGKDAKVRISFTNPLSIELTNAILHVEGQDLIKAQRINIGTVKPNETVERVKYCISFLLTL